MELSKSRFCSPRLVSECLKSTRRRCLGQPTRFYATPSSASNQPDFRAAPAIQFTNNASRDPKRSDGKATRASDYGRAGTLEQNMRNMRIVPASPSYFTATPQYTDDFLLLSSMLRRHQTLPTVPTLQAPRVAWKSLEVYKTEIAEPVRVKGYSMLVALLKRLNQIHPAVFPLEVEQALEKFKRDVQPKLGGAKPILINQWGVARAIGRRKSTSAQVFLVEGDGESLVNGRSLTDYFPRLHDRESALWALKATDRLDKYNVWVRVQGGGTTGQAEAITLGVAKALLAHEPDLKPALRRAGVVSRDARRVERKKPGHVKARKMPAWVKR